MMISKSSLVLVRRTVQTHFKNQGSTTCSLSTTTLDRINCSLLNNNNNNNNNKCYNNGSNSRPQFRSFTSKKSPDDNHETNTATVDNKSSEQQQQHQQLLPPPSFTTTTTIGDSSMINSGNKSIINSTNNEIMMKKYNGPPKPQLHQQDINQLRTVYVHPLSQIVLRYLQDSCHDWICSKQLDDKLILHRDGTFVMESKNPNNNNNNEITTTNNHNNNNQNRQQRSIRIWTYYDGDDRKHWLSVSINQVQHRFLLQDNLMSNWNKGYATSSKRSLAERIQDCVQDLIDAVDELD